MQRSSILKINDDDDDIDDEQRREDGFVRLKLIGACSTCASSTVTLRNGVENMLMHYVPEVKGVEHVQDEDETVGIEEFEKLEKEIEEKRKND